MPWEKRSRTPTRYFTTSKRRNGKVEREYVGTLTDPLVEILAREDRLRKSANQAARDARAKEEEIYQSVEVAISYYHQQLTKVLDYWLRLRRYRREHNHWKKAMRIHTPKEEQAKTGVPLSKDEFDALLKRVDFGDGEAVAELRDLMLGDRETWRPFGDLTEHVKQVFLRLMARNNSVVSESLKIRLEELGSEMDRDDAPPMRKLIVDAVILSWLDYHYAMTLSTESSDNHRRANKLDQRLARSQKRYFAALEFLGRMDKLITEPAAQ